MPHTPQFIIANEFFVRSVLFASRTEKKNHSTTNSMLPFAIFFFHFHDFFSAVLVSTHGKYLSAVLYKCFGRLSNIFHSNIYEMQKKDTYTYKLEPAVLVKGQNKTFPEKKKINNNTKNITKRRHCRTWHGRK